MSRLRRIKGVCQAIQSGMAEWGWVGELEAGDVEVNGSTAEVSMYLLDKRGGRIRETPMRIVLLKEDGHLEGRAGQGPGRAVGAVVRQMSRGLFPRRSRRESSERNTAPAQ